MRKPLWTYLACCIAVFMISMDNLIVTNALPVIRQALNTGLEGLEWTVNAYTMTFAVLLSHPGVADVAVVGVPDRFWGEEVGAVIRASGPVPPAEAKLADYCRARLAAYKTPVRWLFTDAFPLTSTGKIRKDVLTAQLAEAGLAKAGKVPSSAPR